MKTARTRKRPVANGSHKVSTQYNTLLSALQSIKEEELTTQVLQPLLVALGYARVEYHGGTYEEGKDLICQKTDEFGDLALTVVQVKRYRPTVGARPRQDDTFSELVTQLAQAAEKPIPTLTGRELPSQVLLVTPYPINTRSLQSRFERYDELRHRNLKIMDGTKLADLLLKHLPEVVSRYGGSTELVATLMEEELTNLPLMNALASSTRKSIAQFYTDLDFSLGRWTTKLFLTCEFTPTKGRQFELQKSSWESLCRINDCCRSFFHVAFLHEDYERVAVRAEEEHAAWLRKQDLIEEHRVSSSLKDESLKELDELVTKLATCFHEKTVARKKASVDLQDAVDECEILEKKSLVHGEDSELRGEFLAAKHRLDEAKSIVEELRVDVPYHPNDIRIIENVVLRSPETLGYFDESGCAHPEDFAALWTKWSSVCRSASEDLGSEPDCILRVIKALVCQSRRESEFRDSLGKFASYPGYACYRVTIDTEDLCTVLAERRKAVKDTISRFNDRTPSRQKLREFLQECQSLFLATDEILGSQLLASTIGISDKTRYLNRASDEFRLRISIQDVYSTGVNLTVLGEAGAGKTTALQMYARNLYDAGVSECICFFVPLARMVNAWRTIRDVRSTHGNELEAAIVAFIQSLGGRLTTSSFAGICRQRKTVVLLDGVDEAINAAPWILDGMVAFSQRYPKVQVITSSRMVGDYLEKIPFLGVTLRDFTDEQQQRFFRLWFSSQNEVKVADRILGHLQRNSEIREVVRNPLLATVMCEIAAKGRFLPQSELRLFEDRVELLTGRFDEFKGVRRMKSRREDVLHVARKIAYWLQENEQRDEDRHVLYAVAEERAKSRLDSSRAALVVDELVDPCELLVPMTEDGRLGFGHRRYQEHLAAYELARQQWIKILPLLGTPWWRSVFEFYSRMEESIDEFVAFVSRVGLKRECRSTLDRMISVRPKSEHVRLLEIVRSKGGGGIRPSTVDELVRLSRHFNKELLEGHEFFDEDELSVYRSLEQCEFPKELDLLIDEELDEFFAKDDE